MHNMSNTGKEIAARLGFAAMGPAPLKGSPARKAEVAQDKAAAAVRKKALLTKKNVAVLKRIESDYNDAMSGMKELTALMAKKLAKIKSQTVNGDVDAEEYSSVFDEAASGIGQSIEGLNDYNFARSGAKAEFGFGPAATSYGERDQASIQGRIHGAIWRIGNRNDNIKEAKANIQKLTAQINNTRDIKRKAKLSLLLDSENGVIKESIATIKKSREEIKEFQNRAKSLGMTLDAQYLGTFSRPGAKTRMTREQTEEQKAGLKIMSAADPAVGAKIAKLIKEGKPQDQAVAIALDMKRRGEL